MRLRNAVNYVERDGHMVVNDETGGRCTGCTIEDAEAPIPADDDPAKPTAPAKQPASSDRSKQSSSGGGCAALPRSSLYIAPIWRSLKCLARTISNPTFQKWAPVAGGATCLALSVPTFGTAGAICGTVLVGGDFAILVYQQRTSKGDKVGTAAFAAGASCSVASRRLGPLGKGIDLDQACQALLLGVGVGSNMSGTSNAKRNAYFNPSSSKKG